MDFPKKQGQRLIPDYLLDYTTDLQKNHPDPSASWGGGSDYTAGYGIDITNDEISVDTDVIATKSDITSMVTTTMLEDALDDYALSTDIPTNVSELNNDAGYATETWVENKGYLTSITSSDVVSALGYTPGTSNFSGSYNDLTNKPDLSIYAESADLSTVATTGSYNDLSDKPTIVPYSRVVTTDTIQDITGVKTFGQYVTIKDITHAHKTSILPYRFDYTLTNPITSTKTRTLFNLPTSKTGGTEQEPTEYTLATTDDIITSYNDLTDKPTIPTVNNPTITFTQGGTTKGTITLNQSANQTIALDAGGGGGTLSTTSETLTFTYADNTTGTLTVITSVTLS